MKKITLLFIPLLVLFACKSNSSKTEDVVEPVIEETESETVMSAKSTSITDNFALLVDTQNAEYVLALYLPDYGDSCNTKYNTIVPRDKALEVELTSSGIYYRITDKQEEGVAIASPYEEHAGVKLFSDSEDNLIVLGEDDIRDASIDGDGVVFKLGDTNYIQIDVNENEYDEIVIISEREVSHYEDGLTPHCN